MRPRLRRSACGALALAALCGCAAMGSSSSTKPPPPAEPEHKPESGPIAPLLELMAALPTGDPARQAELFQSAKDAASLSPTTSNRLKYALALAIPGHAASNPVAAQRQLSELLAKPETLLPDERLLALVELQEVDQRLVLQAENQRLRDEALHDSKDKLQVINRRLQSESDENARLRRALEEARAKLDAVTHIERSINDRGTSEPPHTP